MESYRPVNCPPVYVAAFLVVEVDTWTGLVRTVQTAMGSDCRTVINPDMAAWQLEGTLSKGAGFALYESNEWDAQGQLMAGGCWIGAKTPGIAESPYVEERNPG